MVTDHKISRRAVVSSLAVAPILAASTLAAGQPSADAELITLGRKMETVSATLDRASDHNEAMLLLDRLEALRAAIVATPAKTLQGLYVKARATAWALEYDCDLPDPVKESTPSDRVAASIVRDLLKLGAE